MAKCAVKRGFFSLRDCGAPASRRCGSCNRFVCDAHSIERAGQFLCVECQAREEGEDRGEVYRYRRGYYARRGYHPFYTGYYHDTYFNDYDARAFDREVAESVETEDESGGGFYDS